LRRVGRLGYLRQLTSFVITEMPLAAQGVSDRARQPAFIPVDAACTAGFISHRDQASRSIVLEAPALTETRRYHALCQQLALGIEAMRRGNADVRSHRCPAPGAVIVEAQGRAVPVSCIVPALDQVAAAIVAKALSDPAAIDRHDLVAGIVRIGGCLAIRSGDPGDAASRVVAHLATQIAGQGDGHHRVAARIPFERRDIGCCGCRAWHVRQRAVDRGEKAAAVDQGVAVARGAGEGLRCCLGTGCWSPSGLGDGERLAVRVELVARLHFEARDDARARNQMGPPDIADILVTLEPVGLERLTVMIADPADADNPPGIVVFGLHPRQWRAVGREADCLEQPAGGVVTVADVAVAASGAIRAAHFQQPVLSGQDGVAVDSFLPQAVSDDGLPGCTGIQRHLLDTGTVDQGCWLQRLAIGAGLQARGQPANREVAFALIVVSVGSDTPDDWIARRSPVLHANACQQCRMTGVFVMVTLTPLAIRPFDADQIGQYLAARTRGTLRQCTAVFICDPTHWGVDELHAAKAPARARQFG
jgi:hypothetical protein